MEDIEKSFVLPESWEEYFEVRPLPNDLTLAQNALATNTRSFILTMIHTYSKLISTNQDVDWSKIQRLHFHFIATSNEMEESLFLEKFEEMLHYIPWLQKLEIVFVASPEALLNREQEWDHRCEKCQQKDRQITLVIFSSMISLLISKLMN